MMKKLILVLVIISVVVLVFTRLSRYAIKQNITYNDYGRYYTTHTRIVDDYFGEIYMSIENTPITNLKNMLAEEHEKAEYIIKILEKNK